MKTTPIKAITGIVTIALLALVCTTNWKDSDSAANAPAASYIVQAASLEQALGAVKDVGGEITHELGIIKAVGALLTDEQLDALDTDQQVRTYSNRATLVAGGISSSELGFTKVINVNPLHNEGIDGHGVTIAVIDTGLWNNSSLINNSWSEKRVLVQYDAITDQIMSTGGTFTVANDESGHGSHITSIALSNKTAGGESIGVAPAADLVSVKAFGADGGGTYLDVIRALDFVVTFKQDYDIRVLNLSFSAPPQSYYWDDPLNQAVMAAWQAGIVVVASAGNTGPDPMTIGVPANVPYIITVGAMTDNYTFQDTGDDMLTSWSAAGPTIEAFVKPELIAPGGHLNGFMPTDGYLPETYTEFYDFGQYFTMSGTSQAAAVVSGVVALLLQDEPLLTPDDVKCRLMSTTKVGIDSVTGGLLYSPFQQGAGRVDAYDAIHEPSPVAPTVVSISIWIWLD